MCGLTADAGDAKTGKVSGCGVQFTLQRWSLKWNEFVDVSSNDDIKGNDKLRVVRKAASVSLYFVMTVLL